jgi:hypothetical protein
VFRDCPTVLAGAESAHGDASFVLLPKLLPATTSDPEQAGAGNSTTRIETRRHSSTRSAVGAVRNINGGGAVTVRASSSQSGYGDERAWL